MKLIIFLISLSILFSFSFELQSHQTFILNSEPPEITQLIKPGKNGLVMEMHSTHSPLRQRLERDATRTKALGINSTVFSGLPQGSGEYFTRIGFGSPRAQLMQVILDIGSDDIWVQCKPCTQCYKQPDPFFNPLKSNTSTHVHCRSSRCPTECPASGGKRPETCRYDVSYGDGSHSSGDYMTETLTFRGTKVKKILFGCGHENTGLFAGADGLLGLGRGKTSFVSQAGKRFGHKFSYCLVDRDSPGKSYVLFGPTALSRKAVYTPMLTNPSLETYYYVTLEGISVGGVEVTIPKGVFDIDERGGGGVVIDSGTSVTRLAQPAYEAVRDAFLNGTRNLKRAPSFSLLDTCYDVYGETSLTVPTVALHFKGGADMRLPGKNFMVDVDDNGTYCFAFAGMGTGEASIIGNIQQQGFRVSFDLKRERIGFTPGSCGLPAN